MSEANITSVPNFDHEQSLDLRERQIAVLGSWSQIGHVIYALGELCVADHLAAGPRTVEELAAATDTNPSALRRVLRCAAAVGIFAEQEDDERFALAPLGEGLKSNKIGGLRPMVLFSAADFTRLPYAEILHSVRTGEPAFDRVYGMPFYKYLETHPEANRFFEGFMTHWGRRLADRFAGELSPERFFRIADIGGGNGYFLAKMLQRHADGMGVLFDFPSMVADADAVINEHGVADRVTIVAGDFFGDSLPAGCDAYILRSILHKWSDQQSEIILRQIRTAMGEVDSRLIVIDQVIPPLNQWDHAKVLDIDMLVLFGGKERNLREWQRLFADTGFELTNQPAVRGWTLLEARPSR